MAREREKTAAASAIAPHFQGGDTQRDGQRSLDAGRPCVVLFTHLGVNETGQCPHLGLDGKELQKIFWIMATTLEILNHRHAL